LYKIRLYNLQSSEHEPESNLQGKSLRLDSLWAGISRIRLTMVLYKERPEVKSNRVDV